MPTGKGTTQVREALEVALVVVLVLCKVFGKSVLKLH